MRPTKFGSFCYITIQNSLPGRAANWESEAKEAMKAISSGKERLEELHKQEEKTRHKLEDTDVVFQDNGVDDFRKLPV